MAKSTLILGNDYYKTWAPICQNAKFNGKKSFVVAIKNELLGWSLRK